jgi:hypothetical protein
MTPADQFGPWAPNLDRTERLARLRSMRAIVRLSCGSRGEALADQLCRAERDPAALPVAAAALNRLASTDRRHVLASFAALHRQV